MSKYRGQYVMIGAVIGVGVGMLIGNIPAYAVLGVGLGFLAGMIFKGN